MRCSSHSFFNFPTPCLSYLAFETTFCKPVLLKLRNECCRNLSLWLFLTQRHSQNVQLKKLIPGARYNIYFLKDFLFYFSLLFLQLEFQLVNKINFSSMFLVPLSFPRVVQFLLAEVLSILLNMMAKFLFLAR